MKSLFSSFVFATVLVTGLVASAAPAPKKVQIRGAAAREIMEALAASGYGDQIEKYDDFHSQPLEIKTGEINCRMSNGQYPDGWMSSATCTKGKGARTLPNSVLLAKVIAPHVEGDSAAGTSYFGVGSISCVVSVDAGAYSCEITEQTF